MDQNAKDRLEFYKLQLEVYKLHSGELRHTANVVWQFSVAILGLQGGAIAGAVALSGEKLHTALGSFIVLVIGFVLSACFSLMLVRQATERGGFVSRAKAVEGRLREVPEVLRKELPPEFFAVIPSCAKAYKSKVLAWILFVESFLGVIVVLQTPPSFQFTDSAPNDSWWKFLTAAVGGVIATFVGFLLNQRHQAEKDEIEKLKKYLIALQSTANELNFYSDKLVQLSSKLANLAEQYKVGDFNLILPSFSLYPAFLEQCKGTLNAFFKNADIVRGVGHCHFELCHILERLAHMKSEMSVPIEGPTAEINRTIQARYMNVEAFKNLVDSNIVTFSESREAVLVEKSKIENDLQILRAQSIFSGGE